MAGPRGEDATADRCGPAQATLGVRPASRRGLSPASAGHCAACAALPTRSPWWFERPSWVPPRMPLRGFAHRGIRAIQLRGVSTQGRGPGQIGQPPDPAPAAPLRCRHREAALETGTLLCGAQWGSIRLTRWLEREPWIGTEEDGSRNNVGSPTILSRLCGGATSTCSNYLHFTTTPALNQEFALR